MGRSEVGSAQSLCERIIEHLLKLEYSRVEEPANHRQREIIEWRLRLEKTLTRSIRAKLDLPDRYRAAGRLLRKDEHAMPETLTPAAGMPVHARSDRRHGRRRLVS